MIDILSRPASRRSIALALGVLAASLATPLAPSAALRAQATPVAAADSARALSLEDAMRVALDRSETVRIASEATRRARGQQVQARSAFFPQLNGTASYQRLLKSQFQALQSRAAAASSNGPAKPTSEPLCRITPVGQDSTAATVGVCPASDGGLGGFAAAFASPNTFVAGITGSQTLFAGGRVTNAYRATTAGVRAADIGLTSAQAALRYQVAQAYFDTQLASRLLVIAESSYVQSERAFRQTTLARQVGNVSEFELLRARVTRDNARPSVIQARTQRAVAELQLRQLLDIPATAPLRLTTDIESGVAADTARYAAEAASADTTARADSAAALGRRSGVPVRATSNAPITSVEVDAAAFLAADSASLGEVDSVVAHSDTASGARAVVRQASEQMEAQRNLLRSARAQRLPSLQLSSNYQRFAYPVNGLPTSFADLYPNWTVALGLSIPIFTGGRIRGDVMVAEANYREAREQLQQAREYATLDAQLSVAQLEQAQSAWQASLGTAEVAVRAFQIADVRYREGISTQLELSESRTQLSQALANRAQAARNLQVARMRLALLRDLPIQGAGGTSAQQQQQQLQQQQQQQAQSGSPSRTPQSSSASQTGATSSGTFQ